MIANETCMHAKSLESYPTLWDPMDCSPLGSSVHGIFLARILEWVAMSSSRRSSQLRDWTHVFGVSCIISRFFTTEPPGKALISYNPTQNKKFNKRKIYIKMYSFNKCHWVHIICQALFKGESSEEKQKKVPALLELTFYWGNLQFN